MATTRQAQAGARRRATTQDDLLAATVRLLQQGAPLAALSIADIVREAGVVRTTFYSHFRDRTELVTALAREQLGWVAQAGQTGTDATRDTDLSRATVRRAVHELVEGWVSRRAVLAAIIETAEHDPAIRALWHDGIHDVAGIAHGVFAARWNAHPEIRPDGAPMIAEVLAWMIERSCHQIARNAADVPDVVDALTEVIWRVLHVPSTA